ncbi:hypothetical protein M0804_006147 [Polistes exclamans]|nr:hypothetical protein M0804_006147 [Polistes exclamans]
MHFDRNANAASGAGAASSSLVHSKMQKTAAATLLDYYDGDDDESSFSFALFPFPSVAFFTSSIHWTARLQYDYNRNI